MKTKSEKLTITQKRNPDDYDLVVSQPFKLKDRPLERRYRVIDFEESYTKKPEVIIIEKVLGKNKLIVKAFVPKNWEKQEKKDDTIIIKKK